MRQSSNFTLILGSKSSRRQQILKNAGFEFSIKAIDCDETYPPELEIYHVAKYLAEKKSNAYTEELGDNEILITADTIVLLNEKILGKPESKEKASKMLSLISGKSHEVITGVCLRSKTKNVSFDDVTSVSFLSLTPEEIEFYIEKDKPFDKAGAYGIQDWIGLIGVDSIQGSYYNVVGLPIHRIYEELNKF